MRELRVLTLHADPGTGLFDDRPLQGYLAGQEQVRCEPALFVQMLEPARTRPAKARSRVPPGGLSGPAIGKRGSPPAHRGAGLSARAAA